MVNKRTGLPDNLKSGIENLSGMSMDDVKVHYNSSRPAQLQAHAYTQGTDIHLAPGQEQHAPHEAWHVAQQAQGKVQSTTGNVPVNDDQGLEQEADVMGQTTQQLIASEINTEQNILNAQENELQQEASLGVNQQIESLANGLQNENAELKNIDPANPEAAQHIIDQVSTQTSADAAQLDAFAKANASSLSESALEAIAAAEEEQTEYRDEAQNETNTDKDNGNAEEVDEA